MSRRFIPRGEPRPASPEVLNLRADAARALAAALPGYSQKMRRSWLAEEMGIEPWHAEIDEMDAVELDTVIQICAEEKERWNVRPSAQRQQTQGATKPKAVATRPRGKRKPRKKKPCRQTMTPYWG